MSLAFLRGLQGELSSYTSVAKDPGSWAEIELLKRRNQILWAWSIERVMFDDSFQEFMDAALRLAS